MFQLAWLGSADGVDDLVWAGPDGVLKYAIEPSTIRRHDPQQLRLFAAKQGIVLPPRSRRIVWGALVDAA